VFSWDDFHFDVHSLVEVNQAGFDACDDSGATVLVRPVFSAKRIVGPFPAGSVKYYACEVPNHCIAGMKVQINVVASSG